LLVQPNPHTLVFLNHQPKISLITPVYNPEKKHLIECIESVLNQSYPNWELCLVDDASTKKYVKEILDNYSKKDKRIKVKFRDKNGHICVASNDALKMAKGEYIGLLDHDDFLWPNALYEVVKLINQKPHVQFIYSDEDKLDYDGKTHVDPFFKPDWSPDYLRSINYITHFAVLKKSLIDKIGGFRVGTEGAQDWDLFLRASFYLEKNIGQCHPLDEKNPIQHISTILYSWRKTSQSTASEKHASTVKNYAYKNQKKVLADDLKRRGYEGLVEPTKYLGLWRVRYKIIGNPLVSIIIPTKDKYEYISLCLNSIIKKTSYKNYELVIVDTGSNDKSLYFLASSNVKYLIDYKNKENNFVLKWKNEKLIKPVYSDSEVVIFKINKYKPRVYFPKKVILTDNPIEIMKKNYFNPIEEVVIYDKKNKNKTIKYDERLDKAIIKEYKGDYLEIEYYCYSNPNGCYLFIGNTYYPGWLAYLDNKQKLIVEIANHSFQALRVPSGTNNIIIKYEPFSFKVGLLFSFMFFIIWIYLIKTQTSKS